MNLRLLRQTLRWQRVRLLVVLAAGIGWGMLMPFVYSEFSDVIREMANSGAIPDQLLNFGSGSLFSLPGTVTLLAAGVNSTVVADENLTVGSTVWLPAESLAPGR